VLAAGRGTRMGTPKALMRIAGGVWWRRQFDAIAALGYGQLWAVSPRVRTELEKAGNGPRAVEVDNGAPMFASVWAGLRELRGDPPGGVFVLPVDVPAPSAEVWRALSAQNAPTVPVCGGRGGHPVWLPWAWLERRIDLDTYDPDARLDELTRDGRTEVAVEDKAVVTNLNTPDDVDRWLDRSCH